MPDPTPLDAEPMDPSDNDFVNEAPGVESSVVVKERAARHTMRLLGRKISLGVGATVINRFSANLDNMYFTTACDNYFTSLALFQELLRRGMYAIGTVRGYHVGFSKSLNVGDNEVRGTMHFTVH